MRFKVQTSSGSSVIVLEDDATIGDLLDIARSQNLINATNESITIRTGFPPKPVANDPLTLLQKVARSGDQLILETAKVNLPTQDVKKPTDNLDKIPSVYNEALDTYTILRNVPDDNSCMFNAIAYALFRVHENAQKEVEDLREQVAKEILSNPKYTELVLGRTKNEYASWISKPTSWGGAIELGILAEKFDISIRCLDVETGKFMTFQSESQPPTKFVVLVYSGIHYDIVARNKACTLIRDNDQCVFDETNVEGETFLVDCTELAHLLQTKNYVTNTTTFRVRCLDCYEILVGEMGASKHAEKTGHMRFGEVK